MPGSVGDRRLLTPRSLRDALRMLDGEGPLTPMAGCTDLYVALNLGELKGTRFLNLWPLEPLRRISVQDGVLSIGALCTYTDLMRSRVVRTRVPMLVAAAREVGGPQIQNRGTIGGNVANASPAGDTLPVLAAAGAMSCLGAFEASGGSGHGIPRVPAPWADELIVAVEFPRFAAGNGFVRWNARARKSRSRHGRRRQRIRRSCASPLAASRQRSCGCRAPRPRSLPAHRLATQQILSNEIVPIDDVRSTAEYRRRVAANLLASFWCEDIRRC
jgi:CO/xanthine dehydrogenase FAD-binding subunit